MGNEVAPEGKVWVCMACGKRSPDKYGLQAISYGWDESCMMNARLVEEDRLVMRGGLVREIKDDPNPPRQAPHPRNLS
jgi:hypothetical protein